MSQSTAPSNITPIVVYDDRCHFCLFLSVLLKKTLKKVRIVPFSEAFDRMPKRLARKIPWLHQDKPSDLLVFDQEEHLLVGRDAWLWLLRHHPNVAPFSWLARKIGLESELAQTLERSGHLLRRFCYRC